MINKIEKKLKKDEKILWKKCEIKNYIPRLVFAIVSLSIIALVVPIIFIFIFKDLPGGFFSLISILGLIYGILGFSIIIVIVFFRQGMKEAGIKLKDLKSYETCYILTNKRWIQKDQKLLLKTYTPKTTIFGESISREKDITSVPLSFISGIFPHKFRFKYHIHILVEGMTPRRWPIELGVKVNSKGYQELWTLLQQLIEFKRSEYVKSLKGRIYYREAEKPRLKRAHEIRDMFEPDKKEESILIFCPHCGKELDGTKTFCKYCGKEV